VRGAENGCLIVRPLAADSCPLSDALEEIALEVAAGTAVSIFSAGKKKQDIVSLATCIC